MVDSYPSTTLQTPHSNLAIMPEGPISVLSSNITKARCNEQRENKNIATKARCNEQRENRNMWRDRWRDWRNRTRLDERPRFKARAERRIAVGWALRFDRNSACSFHLNHRVVMQQPKFHAAAGLGREIKSGPMWCPCILIGAKYLVQTIFSI
jgi:hypothetical protein